MAAIRHAKVSTRNPTADTTAVQPADWNADHVIAADLDVATHKIINVVDPVNAQDAATKQYVDTHGGGGGGITGLTTNTIPKATSSTSIGNGSITDAAGTVDINANAIVENALTVQGTSTFVDTATFGNNISVTGKTTVQQVVGTIISPAAVTGAVNDWNPTGLATASTILVTSSSGLILINGITGGIDGRRLRIVNNDASQQVLIRNENSGSLAANRITTGYGLDITLGQTGGGSVELEYRTNSNRWVVISVSTYTPPGVTLQGNSGVAGQFVATTNLQAGNLVYTNGGSAAWGGGSAAPNGAVFGSPGYIYSMSTSNGTSDLYGKVFGANTNTGWVSMGPDIHKTVYEWRPMSNITGIIDSSGQAVTVSGTATARTSATTNIYTSLQKTGAVSATAARSQALFLGPTSFMCWMGNAAGLGGFYMSARFGISDAVLVTTASMFVGLGQRSGTYNINAIDTITNLIGVGCNSGDTNLQVYGAGSSAQARTTLGASFPVNGTVSTVPYELIMYSAPNSQAVTYQITNMSTGTTSSATLSGVNVPANTAGLCPIIVRCNGTAGATAVGIDAFKLYLETEQ